MYASHFDTETLPRFKMLEEGMPAEVAHQSVKDLRAFDKNPRLNMASYVTTFMEPQAVDLIMSSLNVNLADSEIYPSSTEIRNRCLAMISGLWHSPNPRAHGGSATIGSSEACMLGALNMKKHWRDRQRAAGRPTDRPNIVLSHTCQVCWEKFASYHEVEPRYHPMKEGRWVMPPEALYDLVDENTIGVVAIMGSTYSGHYEDVKGMSAVLDDIHQSRGLDVHIHVDGASGGFVAPFLSPDLEWDFRVPRVASICASGHKYGLVYPGIGWLVWRDAALIHPELDFHVSYLGCDEETRTINFSRPACFVIAQYYQMLRLGRSGYRIVCENMQAVAVQLGRGLTHTGHFEVLNNPAEAVPMVFFCLKHKRPRTNQPQQLDTSAEERSGVAGTTPSDQPEDGGPRPAPQSRLYNEFDVADKMKEYGWMVPAYTLAPDCKHITAMRCVIRVDMSITIIEELVKDFNTVVEWLDHHNEVLFGSEFEAQTAQKFKSHRPPYNPRRQGKEFIPC